MWTFDRYRTWLERRTNWHIPAREMEATESDTADAQPKTPALPKPLPATKPAGQAVPATAASPGKAGGRIEIEPEESPFGKILKR